MALELLIIADDLTGAADTAVQFSKQGFPTVVYLSAKADFRKTPAVAAVTTESRHCPGEEAYRRVKSVTEQALQAGCRKFYKKIDSAFRGNVGAELDALMAAAGARRLPLVPAYPSAGRTTRGGVQYVNGAPLHESPFARDPREPAAESYIPAILASQTRRAVRLAGEAGDGIIVYDAETDADCRAVGAALEKSRGLDVTAGAAGFAEVIADLSAGKRRSTRKNRRASGPLFVVNGSLNEASLNQVDNAEKAGIACFPLPSGGISDRMTASIAGKLRKSGCAVLTTGASGGAAESPSAHAERLGRSAASVINAVPDAAVAVFGGDTAFAVCRGLGCEALWPQDEIMPGLTVCSAGSPAGRIVVLKSGGFGSVNVIRRIRDFLRKTR
ncbi:MAG: hypothetical protein JW699_01550 [Chitinispirillaceae bacterium]|nr:hypothetical protein [Chitinispirillaceae bacterium]